MREQSTRGLLDTEVQQPDPVMDEQPPSPFRVGATFLGALAVVVLVMYGLSRPVEPPQQTAGASQAPAASDQTGSQAAAQPAASGHQAQKTQNQSPAQSQQAQGKQQRSDSATTGQGSAPSDNNASPSKKK